MTRRPGIPLAAPGARRIAPPALRSFLLLISIFGRKFLQPSVRFRKSSMRFNGEAEAESVSFSPARGPRFHQETRLVTFTMFSSATVGRASFIPEFIHYRAVRK